MSALLLVRLNGQTVAKPIAVVRVRTRQGDGSIVYATENAWFGIRLDGETRVDEYAAEHVIGLVS